MDPLRHHHHYSSTRSSRQPVVPSEVETHVYMNYTIIPYQQYVNYTIIYICIFRNSPDLDTYLYASTGQW